MQLWENYMHYWEYFLNKQKSQETKSKLHQQDADTDDDSNEEDDDDDEYFD